LGGDWVVGPPQPRLRNLLCLSQALVRWLLRDAMNAQSAVDNWFAELQHPLKPVMLRVRETILGADERISELVKYGTIHFECRSGMASFVHVRDPTRVSLMFNAAGRLKGEFPHLEGKSVKYMRFADMSDVDSRRSELEAITRAWCDLNSLPSKPAKR
jgi:hypothetical protein